MLRDVVSFARLYDRAQADARTEVRRIMADVASTRYYQKSIHVRLYTLQIPERNLRRILTAPSLRFARSVRSQLGMYNETVPSWGSTISPPNKDIGSPAEITSSPIWAVKGGQARIEVGASSEGALEIDHGERKMEVKFGVYNNCSYVTSPWSRVRYKVLWEAGASSATLLDRVAEAQGDSGASGAASLDIPGQPGRVVLRTEPAGGNCSAGAWWSDLETH
jgi:hypothetical protein